MNTPNSLYTLFSALATSRIHTQHLIVTGADRSFIINKKDLEQGVTVLNKFSKRPEEK